MHLTHVVLTTLGLEYEPAGQGKHVRAAKFDDVPPGQGIHESNKREK